MYGNHKFTFVTGNPNKMLEATSVCSRYGIELVQERLSISEIQAHDPTEIAISKAEQAYRKLGRAVIVNDSSWAIDSLNGFPGGYMHDINQWFTPEDFLSLMHNKKDRGITLTDTIVKYDEEGSTVFQQETLGHIADEVRGSTGAPSDRVIVLGNRDQLTIAERHERGTVAMSGTIALWEQFCQSELAQSGS